MWSIENAWKQASKGDPDNEQVRKQFIRSAESKISAALKGVGLELSSVYEGVVEAKTDTGYALVASLDMNIKDPEFESRSMSDMKKLLKKSLGTDQPGLIHKGPHYMEKSMWDVAFVFDRDAKVVGRFDAEGAPPMRGNFITEQKGYLTVKRPVTEAVEKGALAKFMKELPKGPVAAKIRKGFEKWLKSHADPKLTRDEFIRAWNNEVKKAEEFDDLPMDKAADLYLEQRGTLTSDRERTLTEGSDGEDFAKLLRKHWQHVEYDPKTGKGTANLASFMIDFQESGSDPAVVVQIKAVKTVKARPADVVKALNKVQKILSNTAL